MSQSTTNTDSSATSPETQFCLSSSRPDSPPNVDFNGNHTSNDAPQRSSQVSQNIDGHQHPISESMFAQGGHPVYNSNNFHLSDYLSESEHLSLKPSPQGNKPPGDFGAGPFRSSFNAYNGINGAHAPHSSLGNPLPSPFRMRQVTASSVAAQSFVSASESFPNHSLGIQHQQSQQGPNASSGLESRGIDFGSSPPLSNKISQQFALDPFLQSHTAKAQIHDSFHPLSHNSTAGQVPYLNSIHLHSQTPFGPHLQSSGTVGGAVGTTRSLGTSGQLSVTTEPQGGNNQEEISTIFVVGFPDDMQEREFQNMFTFSSGFEAATLKIPNKEYTAYGSSGGTPSGLPLRGISSYSSYFNSGPNDPYNIVTVNQGGVVVDNGRDGPTTSWPPLPVQLNDEPGHFQGPGGQPPRKQIIGFAKFRTRQEALEARDMLQGRRVDIEKGAVLKAEMAKKNLHTKRGVGISGTSSSSGSVSLGSNLSTLAGLNGGVGALGTLGGLGVIPDTLAGLAAGLSLNSNVNMSALASLTGGDPLGARERELNALSAIGYNNISNGWREGRHGDASEEERERDRDRDRERRREALVGLNLGMSISGRGARERIFDEEERERLRRKDFKATHGETIRALPGNPAVYDAFHPTSTLSRNVQTSILSPSGSTSGDGGNLGPNLALGNGFGIPAQTSRDESGQRETAGPWDQPFPRERDTTYSGLASLHAIRKAPVVPRLPSPQNTSPSNLSAPFSPLNEEDGMLPPHRSGILRSMQPFAPTVDEPVVSRPPAPPSSSTSSTGALDDVGPGPLTVSTSEQVSTGNTSPQLPSPASHGSSAAGSSIGGHITSSSSSGAPNTTGNIAPRNALVDQNPPINTLYVGNLPTSPAGAGYPANYLEDSLRELFSRRPGYRKLCFRQKSNGPMCFVEFEDVHYATKALNELYGNSLGGLVKNGGIRLSYSKNPLGVRTPTTAGNGSLQQQSTHTSVPSSFQAEVFQFRPSSDGDSGVLNIRRDNLTATSPPPSAFGGYTRSPPPPRFVSPPPSGSFNMVSSSPTSGATLPRGSHAFSGFSPFGLPLSSPLDQSTMLPSSHSMIPDHPSSDVPSARGHTQHFPHRALSPSSSTVEATRAG